MHNKNKPNAQLLFNADIAYTKNMSRWLVIFLLSICIHAENQIQWDVIGVKKDGQTQTQITQTLPKGWHTYWKNPGDSGEKASIVNPSPGVTLGEIEFPKPIVIPVDPFITYGYEGTVNYLLPIKINIPTTKITALFKWLECAEVCIPKEKIIELNQKNLAKKWTPPPNSTATIQPIKQGSKIKFILPKKITSAAFFPYKNNQYNALKMKYKNNVLSIKLIDKSIQKIEGELFLNNEPPIIINEVVEIKPSTYRSVIITLLGAFLGGLLLNIMPCVLPILGIKALQLKTSPSQHRIKDAISYWGGITIALLALYGVLMGLKLTGSAIGWGFQLQSPVVIELLIILFVGIMAINLDILRLPLPAFVSKKSNNMLFNGMLTTIIATPCTAPFLGSALAIALFQTPALGLAIFLSISFGLALPMGIIILKPQWHVWLPKSNHWNDQFKFYLNFGFVATIGWLMWVLTSQINPEQVLAFFTGTILLFIILMAKSKQPKKKPLILLISTILLSIIPLFFNAEKASIWQPYSSAWVNELEASKTPYLIDITARWCITCQTNKITVLNKRKTQTYLNSKNITLIQADWTNKDPEISNLLEKYNQISIPTYIYFNGQTHVVFGDILTFNKLKEQLK